jgi:Eisosome component PIL1
MSGRSRGDASSGNGNSAAQKVPPKHRLTLSSLRGNMQPELSKRLFKLIKTENHIIGAYENASRECVSVASQLSNWGESTGDDAVSELSDKLGVLLTEIGEQEEAYARSLEDHRGILKQIRNTEGSVQPSRDHKTKVLDEIQKLKYKDPQSAKLVLLEQELVRAEAENLVAEAQLTNTVRSHTHGYMSGRRVDD